MRPCLRPKSPPRLEEYLEFRVAERTALWYAVLGTRLVRIVAVQPTSSGRKMQAFYSTCCDASAEMILGWYARRWAIDVVFHDVKGHLDFEEPQAWSRKAVERTAPVAMLLYSLIILLFAE